MVHNIATAAQMQALGERLGAVLFVGAVVLVNGGLGAGKTTFAQGVARGLGVTGLVTSPTFALVNEYPEARVAFRHADVYRLGHPDELISAGIAERIGADGAWLVEWAERFGAAWPDGRLEVRIEGAGQGRRVCFVATDARHQALLRTLA